MMLATLGFALAITGKAPKEVNLFVGHNVAPSAKIQLQINTKNVREVALEVYRLPQEELVRRFGHEHERPKPSGSYIRKILVSVAGKKKTLPAPQDTYFARQINIPNLSPGFYLIQAAGYAGASWSTMNVTNLAIVVKRGEHRALTWVTDAVTGRTIDGATVTAYRKDAKAASGVTDKNGICDLKIGPGNDVFLVRRSRDAAAVSVYGSSRDGTPVSHMLFDRPIFRPGQQGYFKAALRRIKGLGYEPIANTPVTMEVFDAQSTLIQREELKTSEIGTVAGKFDIPKEGALGYYSVKIRRGNEDLSLQNFQVAEYRKPEFKVTSTFTQPRYLGGETIHLKLAAEYYFGAKVPGAQVQMTVRRSTMQWRYDGYQYSDGNLYAHDAYAAGGVVANDIRSTNADGTLDVDIPAPSDGTDSTYTFSFVITDGSRRQITHSASVPVYAAAVRVGANSTVGYVPLGRLVPMEVRLADLDGNPVSGKVDLELRHRVWNDKQKREIEETLEKTTVVVPKSGKVNASLPAKAPGYLIIKATGKDSAGRVTSSRSDIHVTDPFSEPDDQKKQPQVDVRLDKSKYDLGDTVSGFVETNQPNRPVLLTMEGSDLLHYMVFTKPGPFTFKLQKAACPNLEFSVSQWVRGNRLSGGAMVGVYDASRRLTVALKPDKEEVSPGDRVRYSVTTQDSKGQPASAEVALRVVDEAIYAVQADNTANLADTFWGFRPNEVSTIASAPEDLSGGAYQIQRNLSKDAPMRTQFVDTAYWSPFLQTDAHGTASVEFEMPGNLTAWRAQAFALNRDTQVGQASAITRSSRPLTLRIATPRQMVVGDHLNLIGTITNRSAVSEKLRLRVQVAGQTLDQTVDAPAKGDARVSIPVTAKELGSMKVTGELFDASGTRVDGLEVGVPVNPDGIPYREVSSGRTKGGEIKYVLPANRIPGSERVKIRFFPGPATMIPSIEKNLLDQSRYSPIISAEQVETAATQKLPWTDEYIREPIAMLGRSHQSAGWGWWDEGTPDPVITARVLRGLTATKAYPEWDQLRVAARAAAEFQYRNVQFAENRALLVEALAIDGSPNAAPWAHEVDESKTPISPTAQLALIKALYVTGDKARALDRLHNLTSLVSRGTSSYLPVGHGVGWAGSQLEANARLLDALLEYQPNNDVIDGLAEWVCGQASRYMGPGDTIAVLRALRRYAEVKPSVDRIGTLHVKANGVDVPVYRQPDGLWAEAVLPESKSEQTVSVEGVDPARPIRYIAEATAYRQTERETNGGIRALSRWEVQNEAGAWQEVDRPIRPNEPVRVSAIVWSDSITDIVRVVLPIPAGFEFVDQDHLAYARNEVRDGAVIYYSMLANGLPQTFRYYIRAESGGTIIAPAAMAEALRRPDVRGNSDSHKVVVAEK